jgi:hypothetical protein
MVTYHQVFRGVWVRSAATSDNLPSAGGRRGEDAEMKGWTLRLLVLGGLMLALSPPSLAGAQHQGHGDMSSHGAGGVGQTQPSGTFTHQVVDQGVRAEFQVMSLATMKMKDTGGATHHIMVKFVREGRNEPIRNVMGKIRVVSPSGKEQVETLKDYSGMYAANFNFPEKGKYEITCVVRAEEKQHVIKFAYPHT